MSTHLGLAHDLAAGPDPDDEDELLARGLLVVRVLHARVRERRLPVVQLLAQLREAPRSGRRQHQLVRAVGLAPRGRVRRAMQGERRDTRRREGEREGAGKEGGQRSLAG